MAVIKLVDTGWRMLSEGDHVLKVTNVVYKEDFGKLEVDMVTQSGETHKERYTLLTAGGKYNEGAQKAFSYFAKTALNNWTLDAIDPDDLVGCYVKATCEHVESDTINENTGKPYVNVRLNDLQHALSFDSDEADEDSDVLDELETIDDMDDLDDWLDE